MVDVIEQSSSRPPAQPSYILRGHTAQIHAVHFASRNTRLVTGDADGWIVVWNLPLKRPAAVWKAHSNTVLGLTDWQESIITHGRDGRLCVWQLRDGDEDALSKVLPVDDLDTPRKEPWLLHSVLVHTLNFCAFASCQASAQPLADTYNNLLVAVSGVQDGTIMLLSLPDETHLSIVPTLKDVKTGMLMAISLQRQTNAMPLVVAGYESGHTAVWRQTQGTTIWQSVYVNQAHTQPIMSLAIAHKMNAFFTSSADAIIARHSLDTDNQIPMTMQTKHAGQQSLQIRSDERIFATAGWDTKIRVYSTKTMKELAVLKWHREGCYATAFAPLDVQPGNTTQQLAVRSSTVSQRRIATTQTTHWLAAGSKDGKVSLWDIY